MSNQYVNVERASQSQLVTNKVLRNTYILLSLTLLFGGACAGFAMMTGAPHLGFFTIAIYFGLLFLVSATANSAFGIVSVFALTGFLGYTLGPMLNAYMGAFSNGPQLVMTALAGTGIIFFALSAYILTTGKDMSYLGGFLMAGIIAAFIASLGAMFFQIPMLSLVVSAAFMLLSSGLIMFETSQIIHGGQTNYILATVTLYVSLYNLFVSLLQILAAFSGRD